MNTPNTRIVLWPLTRKAENRLREAGTATWEIARVEDAVLFDTAPGPWLYVMPCTPDDRKRVDKARWIHGKNDKDFQIKQAY